MITDPNFALHLIHEVQLQPCLFDIKDSKYRHTEYRNQAWNDIIKNLNFPGYYLKKKKLILFLINNFF